MTSMFDAGVIWWGEIRCLSLSGAKVLSSCDDCDFNNATCIMFCIVHVLTLIDQVESLGCFKSNKTTFKIFSH